MSTDRLRELATTMTDMGLTGPWGWFGDTDYQPPYLATEHSGRNIVMSSHARFQVSTREPDQDDVDDCDALYETREVEEDEAEGERLGEGLSVTAQITFAHRGEGDTWNRLVRADQMPVFEVAPDALTPDDPAVYRTQVRALRNPVATYLAAVDPSTVLALLDRIEDLEGRLADARSGQAA